MAALSLVINRVDGREEPPAHAVSAAIEPLNERLLAAFSIGTIAVAAPALESDSPNAVAHEMLQASPDLPGLPVIDRRTGRILGLVDRLSLLSQFARPLMRDLYGQRPVSLLMSRKPFTVDAATLVDEVLARIPVEGPQAITAGFIVTADGRYLGVANALDTMRLSAELARQRARELDLARVAAEDANRAKSRFLANMSHELRTPLNAIIGFAELIERQAYGAASVDRYVEYASDIRRGGHLLLDLINDLLDLSKAEAGRIELRETPVDLGGLAEDCARLLRGAVQEAGLVLELRESGPPAILYADELKLRQVLLNLLGNARKFTPAGGRITITVERRPGDSGVAILVADTGIGIAPENMERVLEPFTQIDGEFSRRHAGTGLGLPLAKKLVELHGGELLIHSTLGQGTTVEVIFPQSRIAE